MVWRETEKEGKALARKRQSGEGKGPLTESSGTTEFRSLEGKPKPREKKLLVIFK